MSSEIDDDILEITEAIQEPPPPPAPPVEEDEDFISKSAGQKNETGLAGAGETASLNVPGIQDLGNGEFQIADWDGYPDGPKPQGPFRVLKGEEYEAAKQAKMQANKVIHDSNSDLAGLHIHEIHPVKFGGDPVDSSNKIVLTKQEHAAYTAFWNRLQNKLEK